MNTEHFEDTVEGRIIAYADFTFITAKNFLRPFAQSYGFDLQMEAQDIAQDVAIKTLSSDAYGPSLGATFFKTVTENACKNLLESKQYERVKGQRWGSNRSWVEQPEQAGWLDLTAAVRRLPKAQKMAVYERYLGYPSGTLSGGSEDAGYKAIKRAEITLTQHMNYAA